MRTSGTLLLYGSLFFLLIAIAPDRAEITTEPSPMTVVSAAPGDAVHPNEQLSVSPPNQETVAQLKLARELYWRNKHRESLNLYEQIAQRHPHTAEQVTAWLGMASAYRELNDEKKMVAMLNQVAELADPPENAGLSEAWGRLGYYHFGQRSWKDAARWLTPYEPEYDFCGTCQADADELRFDCLVLSQLHLNQHSAAARLCLSNLKHAYGKAVRMSRAPSITFRLYREAGQLEDLRRMVDEVDAQCMVEFKRWEAFQIVSADTYATHLPGVVYRDYARLFALAKSKEYSALIEIATARPEFCQSFRNSHDWHGIMAAEALASCDGGQVPAIEAALNAGLSLPEYEKKFYPCLLYSLAKSMTPQAVKALGRLRTSESIPPKLLAEALVMQGAWGKWLLSKTTGAVYRAANEMSDADRTWLQVEDWPPPQRGSLPRELPSGG